ncbi:MAG TPA: hypothetical protein VFV58_14775 [Blastocatellia bacterium]|nr:hypothetical protein [Blastocatellia bacterium]
MNILLAIALLFLPSVKQTTDEFGQKYKRHESGGYIVRPGIVMKVKATRSGDACEAKIKPMSSTASKDHGSEVMPSETAKEVVDEIIPEAKRGKITGHANANDGCTGMDIIGYEKAMIVLVTRCKEGGGGVYSARIQWIRDECPDNKPLFND